MRISGWSSDVCSSDLPQLAGLRRADQPGLGCGGLVDHVEPNAALEEEAHHADDRVRLGRRALAVRVVELLHALRGDGADREIAGPFRNDGEVLVVTTLRLRPLLCVEAGRLEIGRASCRERVWQYV